MYAGISADMVWTFAEGLLMQIWSRHLKIYDMYKSLKIEDVFFLKIVNAHCVQVV
jgi:hypothetical protein